MGGVGSNVKAPLTGSMDGDGTAEAKKVSNSFSNTCTLSSGMAMHSPREEHRVLCPIQQRMPRRRTRF
jgi:hypothetical protein